MPLVCVFYLTLRQGLGMIPFGKPIQQEDLIGTNLTFSLIGHSRMEENGGFKSPMDGS